MTKTILAQTTSRRLISVVFTALLLAPAAARAAECPASSPEDPQERRKLAKEWFATAESAEGAGNDAEATRSYACSYKMVAHPFTAFNLGRVAERSGENELALKMYKAYLTLKPDAQDKDEVTAKVKALEEKIASGGDTTGTTPAGTSPETPKAEPEEPLEPPPQPKPVRVAEKPREPEQEPEASSHTLEWVVGGVSGAALVTGIVLNLSARSKMSSCQADASNNLLGTANDECNAARPLAYASYGLIGAAAVGVAVDAVLILMRGNGGSSSSGGGDENASTSVGVLWLPGGGGLAARGRF